MKLRDTTCINNIGIPTFTNTIDLYLFLETNDVPMPDFLQFLAVWMNEGERYEKIPRFIPYFVLPLSMALMTFRVCQVGWSLIRGEDVSLIASHEAQDAPAAGEPGSARSGGSGG